MGTCLYAMHLANALPADQQKPDFPAHPWGNVGIAFVLGIILIWIGWRSALAADMTDSDAPSKPKIRF